MTTDVAVKERGVLLGWVTLVALGSCLLAGGWGASQAWGQLTHRMDRFEERMGALPTRTEVTSIRDDASAAALRRIKQATVRCPRTITRGLTIDCVLVWSPE